MRSPLSAIAAFVFCLVAHSGPVWAQNQCTLKRITSLDMVMSPEGRIYVPASIGDHDIKLMVDTGGVFSTLKEQTAAALQLEPKEMPHGSFLMGFGGTVWNHYVRASSVKFGTLLEKTMDFVIIPGADEANEMNGTLSPDLMKNFDAEFDFANGKFFLYSQDHCEGQVVYWTRGPYARVPFKEHDLGHVAIEVMLDGKRFLAEVDTGSTVSVINFERASYKFNWDDKTPGLKSIDGSKSYYEYPFKQLSFEGVSVNNPVIGVVSDRISSLPVGKAVLILGMGVLRQLHIYIAYKEHNLYLTPATAH